MLETASASRARPAGWDFIGRWGEGKLLTAMLALYALVSIVVWVRFETQYDDAGYTDPAASYALGQGFTSGCWYAQTCEEFWAGNVPLHQFFLIGAFKLLGFSKWASHTLLTLYSCLAMLFLWIGMRRSGWIPQPGLRLGAIAFFLASSNSAMMAIGGRPEPLCLLLASVAWAALTLENARLRRTVLAACGALAPWIGLQVAVFFAFFGILALLFDGEKQWANVLAVACGGIAGTAALLFFYWRMGTLDAFLISIAPHSSIPAARHRPIEGVSYIPRYDQLGGPRFGLWGYADPSVVYGILLSAAVCWSCVRKGIATRLAAFDAAVIAGLPLFFAGVGIFPYYYAPFLFLPMTVLLFTLLARQGASGVARSWVLTALLWASACVPASYLWRLTAQGIPSALDDVNGRMERALRRVTRPDDVAWVDITLWYETKPLVKRVLSAHWGAQAKTAKERDAVSVLITVKGKEDIACLPGTWAATGETVDFPDYHRFYRVFAKRGDYHFAVYRRVPPPGN